MLSAALLGVVAAATPRDSAPGAGATLPILSGLVGWWDASDDSTVAQSGGAVSQWSDRSGNANHATQATGSAQPQMTTASNGLDAIDFGILSSGLWMGFPGDISSGKTFIAVVSHEKGGGFLFGHTSGTPFYPYAPGIAASPLLYTSYSDSHLRTGGASARINGAAATVTSTFKDAGWHLEVFRSDGTAVTVGNLCNDRGVPARKGGTIYGEVAIYDSVLSDADVITLESHLAQKWGIGHKLPYDHDGHVGTMPTLPIAESPLMWLDASNADYRRIASGRVVELTDIACNAHSMGWIVSAATAPELLAAEQNGLDAADFQQYAGSGAGRTLGTNPVTANTFAVVLKTDAGHGGGHALSHVSLYPFHRGGADNTNYASAILNSTYASANLRTGSANTRKNGTVITATSTGYDNGWQVIVFRTNGSSVSQGQLARDRTNGSYGGIIFGEELAFSSVLSDADTEKIEGYLAWKWGLEGSLPGGHPYKSSPP